MGTKGHKSKRGKGEIYAETKAVGVYLLLTETASQNLQQMSLYFNLSKSELIERIARGRLSPLQLSRYYIARQSQSKKDIQ